MYAVILSEVHPYIRYAVIRNIPPTDCAFGTHRRGRLWLYLSRTSLGSPPVLSLHGASLGNSSIIFVTSASLGSSRPSTDCAFGTHRQERSWLYVSHTSELKKDQIALADNIDRVCSLIVRGNIVTFVHFLESVVPT